MSRFFPIAPPPQSLERLDAWGTLDALPWPLDSDIWRTAGIGGLEVAEQASTSAALPELERIRLLFLEDIARTAGALSGTVSSDRLVLLTAQGVAASSAALALGVALFIRGREAEHGMQTAGALALGRVLPLNTAEAESSRSGGRLLLAFKGWNWEPDERAFPPVWKSLPRQTSAEAPREQVWAALPAKHAAGNVGNWRPQPSGGPDPAAFHWKKCGPVLGRRSDVWR